MSSMQAILSLLQASATALEAAKRLMETLPQTPAPAVPQTPQAPMKAEKNLESASDWPVEELNFEAVTVEAVVPVEVEAVTVEAEPEPKAKKDKRVFAKLNEALPFGTSVTLTSLGDAWTAVFTPEGFKMGDSPPFKSPMAFTRAHANRITDAHPNETKPGNGWDWIKIESGEHAGKTIGQRYNEHFTH
jgi:hypothetical protein